MSLRIGRKKYRRRHVRKFVWIMITAVAALAMVVGSIGPAMNGF